MADPVPPQALAPADAPSDNANPSKFFRYFLYKVVVVTIFLVLLPILPSIAPEFVNQTLHARSWELLQLIFVGIAVSYGLFSKKNDEIDNGYGSKLDSAQSYVSKLLQVSSVFDDESEHGQTVIDDGNKVQTWSSQYFRGEPPVVVVAEGNGNGAVSGGGNGNGNGNENGAVLKPLLLPVRSLKQQQGSDGDGRIRAGSGLGSGSGVSRRFGRNNSRRLRNEDEDKVQEDKDNVVLPSPIPWRSRSGRMEMMENGGEDGFVVSPMMEKIELSRNESRGFKSPKVKTGSKNLSPSMSFQSVLDEESGEDVVRKKGFVSLPPAPPPPPPPPPAWAYVRKPVVVKSNSSVVSDSGIYKKELRRSVRSMPTEEFVGAEMEEPVKMSPGAEFRGRATNDVGKSVRTFRPNDVVLEADIKGKNYEARVVEKKGCLDSGLNVKLPNELIEKVVVESSNDDEDSESDSEVDNVEGSSCDGEAAADENGVNELGPDVDKKADEFIAKFREQIRLQRIESIRRSTAQRTGRTFR